MQHRLLRKSLLLFLITTCFALSLHTDDVRVKRETSKPGFFRTLFSVGFEQWTDTKNTFSKISEMLNENFLPEDAPITTVAPPPITDPNVTTKAAPFKIKRSEFSRILTRNFRGLVRLFNIELQEALKQSRRTDIEYRKNATAEYSKFL